MAEGIIVIGDSGSGKSTSIGGVEELGIKGLDPKETIVINVKNKPLPFRGWKNQYTGKISEGGNYFASANSEEIIRVLKYISDNRPEIKNVVLDDFQYTMSEQFMKDAFEIGFDKFTRIGKFSYDIINAGLQMRSDINFIILTHSDEENNKLKMKTLGRLLDDKVNPIGLFTVALFTAHRMNADDKLEYGFVTNRTLDPRGFEIPAKSPVGMFENLFIPNDMGLVIEKIKKNNEGE